MWYKQLGISSRTQCQIANHLATCTRKLSSCNLSSRESEIIYRMNRSLFSNDLAVGVLPHLFFTSNIYSYF